MTQLDVRADVRTTVTREEFDALARHAESNEQSVAQLVRLIIRRWLRDQTSEVAA